MKKITKLFVAVVAMICCYTATTQAQGLNFGAYSYITLGDIVTNNQSYSKEAWIRIHYYSPTHGSNILSAYDFPFWLENGVLSAANSYSVLVNNSPVVTVQDNTQIPLNTWVHVAVTYDAPSTTMKLYKNGVLIATNTAAPTYYAGDLQIGAQEYGDFFDGGDMDEVRLWSVALTQAQIQANMNCDVPQQSTLQAYYRFDQGTIGGDNTALTMVYDYSGNTHCGNMVNFNLNGTSGNYIAGELTSSCNPITVATAAPGSITGASAVCTGATTQLGNSVAGGKWTVDSLSFGDVSATGLVSGLNAGVINVRYATCGGSVTKTLTVNPSPSVLGTAATGTISTTVSGGSAPYTYAWSNGSTSANLTGLASGTYGLTVTDAKGCTATGSYYVATSAITLTSTITITPTTTDYTGGNCHNFFLGYGAQSAVLTDVVTGATSLTYSWSPSAHLSSTTTRNPTFTTSTAGTYTYTCTATTSTGYSISSTVSVCVTDIVDHAHAGKFFCSHVATCGGTRTVTVRSMSALEILLDLLFFHEDYLGTVAACSAGSRNSAPEETTSMVLMGTELQMNVFPNPFNDAISIKVDGGASEFADVKVYDVAGRMVAAADHQSTDNTITVGQNLASGMYLIEVKKGELVKRVKVAKTN